MNLQEYTFLDNSIIVKFPDDWRVRKQGDHLIKVSFPFGPYPTLDCYFNCFDNPKISTDDKVKQYILNGTNTENAVETISNNTYVLKHKFRSDGDNLLLIKIVSILKPRTFREIRFSLAWPDNQEANKIVSKLSRTLDAIVNKIKFSELKTEFDNQGVIKNKLNNLILQRNVFWEKLEILLPKRWMTNKKGNENHINLELDKVYQLSLLFEYFEINISKNNKNQDEVVTSLLNEITKDVVVHDQKLVKAGDDNFLYSFYSIENNEGNQFKNHIWYRICVKDTKILIVSFVFIYKLKTKIIAEVYYDKINELIKSSELN